jgi:hypothetical protein
VDFIPIVHANIPIANNTIVPAGVISKIYEISIPATTENIEKLIEIIAVCLNPLPYIIAVTFGITNRAEINKTPTSCIEVTTVIPAIKTIR